MSFYPSDPDPFAAYYAAHLDPFSDVVTSPPPPSALHCAGFLKRSKQRKRKVMVMRRPLPISLETVAEADEEALSEEDFYSGCESFLQDSRSRARPRREAAVCGHEKAPVSPDSFGISSPLLADRRGSDDDISASLSLLNFPLPPSTIPEPTSPTAQLPLRTLPKRLSNRLSVVRPNTPPPVITLSLDLQRKPSDPLSPLDPDMPLASSSSVQSKTPVSPGPGIHTPASPVTFFSPLFNGLEHVAPLSSLTSDRPPSPAPSFASLELRVGPSQTHSRQLSTASDSGSSYMSEVHTDTSDHTDIWECAGAESWDAAIDEIYKLVDAGYPTPSTPLCFVEMDDLPPSVLVPPNSPPGTNDRHKIPLPSRPPPPLPHKRKVTPPNHLPTTSRRGPTPPPLTIIHRPPPLQAIPTPPFSPADSLFGGTPNSSRYDPSTPSKLRSSVVDQDQEDETEVEKSLISQISPPSTPPRKRLQSSPVVSANGKPPIPTSPKPILRSRSNSIFPTSPDPLSPAASFFSSPMSPGFSPRVSVVLSPTSVVFSPVSSDFGLVSMYSPPTISTPNSRSHSAFIPSVSSGKSYHPHPSPSRRKRSVTLKSKFSDSSLGSGSNSSHESRRSGESRRSMDSSDSVGGSGNGLRRSPIPVELFIR